MLGHAVVMFVSELGCAFPVFLLGQRLLRSGSGALPQRPLSPRRPSRRDYGLRRWNFLEPAHQLFRARPQP